MANLTQIVYLTREDYEALLADTHDPKQYTKNGKTIYYDENALYITPETVTMEDLSGTLPVSKGGTGASSFTSGQLLVGNGTNAVSTKAISGSIINDANTIPTTQAVYNYDPYSVNTNYLTKSNKTFSVSAANVSNMINLLDTGASDLTANDFLITQYVGGGTSNKTYYRRAASKVINGTLVKTALGTNSTHNNQFLRKDGTWQTPPYPVTSVAGKTGVVTLAKADVGLGSVSNNTALNSSTGTKGDIIYWSAANTPARLGANTTTTPKYLCMTSSAPVWQEIIPTSNLDLTAITTAEIDAIITGNSSGTLTVPTKTSQLTNDSSFLVNTNNVINLNSYGAAIGMTSTSTSSAKKFEVNSNYTSYLNGPVNVAGTATFSGGITGVTNYTTSETLTGGTWIDGKPLYRRTYVFDAAGTIDISNLNYDFIHIIDMVANTKYSNANDIWTGTYYWGSTADRLHIYIDQDGLKLRFGTSVTLYRGAWVTVEYTKATT